MLDAFFQDLSYALRGLRALVYAAVAVVLLIVALAASWLPALRASRVEPTRALRYE